MMMFPSLLEKLRRHEDLSSDEAARAMGAIMDGEAQPAHIAALLMALALKGERPAEMVGFATAMRARAVRLPVELPDRVRHVRHGRRRRAHVQRVDGGGPRARRLRRARGQARQSRRVEPVRQRRRLRGAGRAPRRAARPRGRGAAARPGSRSSSRPSCHPSMRHAAPTRRELGVRTAFNLLGPLTNPAGAEAAARRRVASRAHGAARARARRPRRGARLGRARRRRSRRDLDRGPHEGFRVPGRRWSTRSTCTRRTSGCPWRSVGGSRGRHRSRERRPDRGRPRRRARAAARRRAAQCGRRHSWWPARRRRWGRA